MIYKRGDIVLVPFPFSDLSAAKNRPVLLLTDPDKFGDFLAVGVTSRSHHALSIPITTSALESGELPLNSWVRFDRIITLNQGLVLKCFAQANFIGAEPDCPHDASAGRRSQGNPDHRGRRHGRRRCHPDRYLQICPNHHRP